MRQQGHAIATDAPSCQRFRLTLLRPLHLLRQVIVYTHGVFYSNQRMALQRVVGVGRRGVEGKVGQRIVSERFVCACVRSCAHCRCVMLLVLSGGVAQRTCVHELILCYNAQVASCIRRRTVRYTQRISTVVKMRTSPVTRCTRLSLLNCRSN